MANWISNHVEVVGDRSEVDAFMSKVRGRPAVYAGDRADDDGDQLGVLPLCFNATVPVPGEILAAGYIQSGRDWQLENWGTTWEIDDCDFKDRGEGLYFFFSTGYWPPLPWVEKTSAQFSNLEFRLVYRDWSAGIEGAVLFKNGSEVFHHARENFHMDTLNRDGHSYDRVPVGQDKGDWQPKPEVSCPECSADFLEFHEWGCLKEPCPICKGQLVTCGCQYERHHCGAA